MHAPTKKKAKIEAPAGLPTIFELAVLSGLDTGLVITIDASLPRILVGKSPACTIRLTDPCVSRRHAALDVSDNALRLIDLDSTNGTTVNGVRIRDASLSGGETLLLGDTTIGVRRKGQRFIELPETTQVGRFFGESPAMRKLFPLVERIIAEQGPVLIEGEPGVGKELLAEEIHERGARRGKPFVVLEGDLTKAIADAKDGTLFIDELTTLDAAAQAILLTVRGPRVIGATTSDLDAAVEEGGFSDDLFRILAASRIELPPLRERTGDVVALARRFWVEAGGEGKLPGNFIATLARSRWPGNITELRTKVIEQVVNAGPAPAPTETLDLPFPRAREEALRAFEHHYISSLLARHDGNITRAASASGIALRYFQRIKARHL